MKAIIYHNINETEQVFHTEKDLVTWVRKIKTENEDNDFLNINTACDALAYIHSYCGNFDIKEQNFLKENELLNY